MNRKSRARIAQETLEILERGHYTSPAGEEIALAERMQHAREKSVLYSPDMFAKVMRRRDDLERSPHDPVVEVVNETTLAAARSRTGDECEQTLLCLNFASAKNPGGGFLGGSRAQEESLARASGLYPCINQMQEMYTTNRALRNCLYTDHMIYSPDVPVIRDDEGELLDDPYLVSFLTVPAVNAGAVRAGDPARVRQIAPTMIRRMEKLLSVAVVHGHRQLILGAWGCGVFKNDSADVARWFHDQLMGNGRLQGLFDHVVFAITDWSEERRFIGPFEQRFGIA